MQLVGYLTCKIVLDMTCNVFGGTLNPTQSVSYSAVERRTSEFLLQQRFSVLKN